MFISAATALIMGRSVGSTSRTALISRSLSLSKKKTVIGTNTRYNTSPSSENTCVNAVSITAPPTLAASRLTCSSNAEICSGVMYSGNRCARLLTPSCRRCAKLGSTCTRLCSWRHSSGSTKSDSANTVPKNSKNARYTAAHLGTRRCSKLPTMPCNRNAITRPVKTGASAPPKAINSAIAITSTATR